MPTILGANSVRETGYNVDNSLRFDAASSSKITRTISSSGSTKIFTTSFWMKLSAYGTNDAMPFGVDPDGSFGNNMITMEINADRKMRLDAYISGAYVFRLRTKRKFRDETGFYHIVFAVDTSQSTEANRVRLYVNGVEETDFESTSYPSLNTDININNSGNIINFGGRSGTFFPGYLCEVAYIDGTQLAASDFGEFDSDSPTHWKPKEFKDDVTFGTNGSYLEFKDSSALGDDTSGNNNDFSLTNLAAIDQTTDTCTNNFCTHNPLIDGDTGYSEGNLDLSFAVDGTQLNAGGTIGFSSGKWYWEHKIISSGNTHYLGIKSADSNLESTTGSSGSPSMYYTNGGNKVYNASSGGSSYGNTFTDGDIIGVALDLDNNAIWFSKNGTWQNSATQTEVENGTTTNSAFSGTSSSDGFPSTQIYLPWIVGQKGGSPFTMTTNFGNPTFSISSGNSDSEGFGNFEYAVPSGFFAICTKNLAEYGG